MILFASRRRLAERTYATAAMCVIALSPDIDEVEQCMAVMA
jgi:hypothetical protein